MMNVDKITAWMAWKGGADLAATTIEGADQPNLIVHVADIVHTPIGSAPSGIVFYQPDPSAPPLFAAFVSTDPEIGAYFGPAIFAGTPFETLPVQKASIEVDTSENPHAISATVRFDGFTIKMRLGGLDDLIQVDRPVNEPLPFNQMGLEATASTLILQINDEDIDTFPLEFGPTGSPAAVWSPCGVYAR